MTIEKESKKFFLALLSGLFASFTFENESLIQFACRKGNIEFLKILEDRYLPTRTSYRDQQKCLHGAMIAAVEYGKIEVVKYLADKQLSYRPDFWWDESIALHIALNNNRIEMFKFLLDKGCNVDCLDSSDWTVAFRASWSGNIEFLKILIDKKANLNYGCEKGTRFALETAASYGRLEIVKLLLANGANVSDSSRSKKECALYIAARGGYLACVKAIVEHGAYVDFPTASGETALWIACSNGKVELVKYLLDQGADVNVVNKYSDYSALAIACDQGHHEIVKLLVERGASLQRKTFDRKTPLDIAIHRKHTLVVDFLTSERQFTKKI